MPNRLINETSPYLRQHAHNPVDWYPWGEEAFRRAREEDKPILLSIGYSACHWCHVMERECFQDQNIASLMNSLFINIKVDREERPDIDAIYMQAVQAMTGGGGWPLTVFLTPEGEPFFGGTYFPPEDRHGLPGFPRVLQAVAQAYQEQRDEIKRQASQVTYRLRRIMELRSPPEALRPEVLDWAFQALLPQLDEEMGGLAGAPKFPQPLLWEFMLRYYARRGDVRALEAVTRTLRAMASGGIYDHLGGGFHRYAVDRLWVIPHFEKMLYDNALLARLYLHAFQVTGEPLFAQVAQETLHFLLDEMQAPEGGFYSSLDADSEGEEGRFYVWALAEVMDTLGEETGKAFALRFGLTPEGNFEGRNVLYLARATEEVASALGWRREELEARLQEGKQKLLERRHYRPRPAVDDKIMTNWNGLVMASLAEAYCVLGGEAYRTAAIKCARFIVEKMMPHGRLIHSYKDGQGKVPAFLDDYACLIDGLIGVHEATFQPDWLRKAIDLAHEMVDLFWDEGEGLFFDTGPSHETLVVRPREVFDNATPCGSSMATEVLLRLSFITGDAKMRQVAAQALRSVRELMVRAPAAMGNWLCALDLYLSEPKEVAVIGARDDEATAKLLAVIYKDFWPNKVVVGIPPGAQATGIALLEGKTTIGGQPTCYLCKGMTCQEPTNSPEVLARQWAAQ